MSGNDWVAERFEANRSHLRAVAFRMLGSAGEADDAVQECWIRVNRADAAGIDNLEGWLTTVVARICLNILRSRTARREEALEESTAGPRIVHSGRRSPQDEALLAESVGLAFLVVLERLTPAERVAFVLHDVFGVSFEEIASIVDRTPTAARQLASRARRRVRGGRTRPAASLSGKRQTVEAFLRALRAGDIESLLAVLDSDVVRRADRVAVAAAEGRELRGARDVAQEALTYSGAAQIAQPVVVDGDVGFVIAPGGRLRVAVRCTVRKSKITAMEVIADPARLRTLNFGIPPD
ncbi:sigma-70 family RNA polymerase sigma factor [Occallatibacter riparius]|uniref:Sigma-70 family RNA polymerase sigma factor n=1 Tax=Occallatibacter riparius TaxID=1002689 RepID=A0A9J7BVE4_9BACT|nr:sigma-70 family RNA polymerase sigma factor [Occallatibacter riparius]UWZ85754.1 sigma-70 family RNA polymerase sigma factor [Occallatibacter riparius]